VDKFVERQGKSADNPTTFNTMMRFALFLCNRVRRQSFRKACRPEKFALMYSEQSFERDDASGKCSTPFHEAATQNRVCIFESFRPNAWLNL